jgi:hypothetical protein
MRLKKIQLVSSVSISQGAMEIQINFFHCFNFHGSQKNQNIYTFAIQLDEATVAVVANLAELLVYIRYVYEVSKFIFFCALMAHLY